MTAIHAMLANLLRCINGQCCVIRPFAHLERTKRFHKWPNYEVLELLVDPEAGLYGFHVHHSDGTKSTITRSPKGVGGQNLMFGKDGSIEYLQ